jgi:CheY-like chemotaxis protein
VARKELLLVVDDSDLTRKMLCRIMKAQGYDCEEAEDGAEAVHRVRERHAAGLAAYDGILMDFVMYVQRGFSSHLLCALLTRLALPLALQACDGRADGDQDHSQRAALRRSGPGRDGQRAGV